MRSGRQMWESGIGRKRVEERGLTRGVVDEDDEEVMFEVRRGEGGGGGEKRLSDDVSGEGWLYMKRGRRDTEERGGFWFC